MNQKHSSRRKFLKNMFYSTLSITATAWLTNCSQQEKTPNILFCISDDQSYPHTSAYGCSFVNTPAFDRVAEEGILFHNCFVSSPSCCPSRSSLLTGQAFYRLKESSMNHTIWPADFKVYPDILAAHGYFVGYTGKGWGPGNWKIAGRTHNPAGPVYNTAQTKPPAKGMSNIDYYENFKLFLEKRSKDTPFCFWYGASEPHRVYEPGSGVRLNKKLEDVKVPQFFPDSNEVRTDMTDYAVEIEWFDSHMGMMIKLLEDMGELDNTIIVVTADNGMPFPRAKATLYDYGTRMPLAIRWGNKIKSGRIVNDFVSFTDFAPTFLEAAKATIPEEMTGKSLMHILKSSRLDRVEPERDHAIFGIERHFPGSRPDGAGYPMRAIRTEEYLYIRNYQPELNPVGDCPGQAWPADDPTGGYGDTDGGLTKTYIFNNRKNDQKRFQLAFGKRPAEELYDVIKDPDNVNNLADNPDYAEVKKSLAERLQKELAATGDPRATSNAELFDKILKKYSVIGSNL
ncbi:MAG: sulfatase [bacterium]|nr:MAG: sulfatase [bacterium]